MEYSISLDSGGKFIRIIASGEIRVEDTARMATDGLAAGKKSGCTAFLVDYRGAVATDSTFQTYNFMSGLDQLGVPRHAKIAIVVDRDQDDHRFAETVAVNRGWFIRYFTDPEKAESWLAP